MSYAEPRRGLALTFGTLLSSQGAGAHRQRPFGPSSGQLAQHMGGSGACQPASMRSERTRSVAPGAPCRRRDRHPQRLLVSSVLRGAPVTGQPFEVSSGSVFCPEARAEARWSVSGGSCRSNRHHRHPRLCRLPGGPPCGAKRKLRGHSEGRQLGGACQVSLTCRPRAGTSCCNATVMLRWPGCCPSCRPGRRPAPGVTTGPPPQASACPCGGRGTAHGARPARAGPRRRR
jgi:hypothetical protein